MSTATLEPTTVNRMPESDVMAHIEDTRLFWVFRNGRNVKISWNEMSEQEHAYTIEAERRAYFRTEYGIYE